MNRPTNQLAPYLRLLPDSLSPVLLTCEHAGNAMPVTVAEDDPARALLDTHWGWDPGAWALTACLSEGLNAGAVGGRWSRLWVDVNRRIDDPTLARPAAALETVSWNVDLTPEDIEARVESVHTPYHAEIDRQVHRRLLRGIRPLLFSVHTFTGTLAHDVRDFDIGVLFNDHHEEARHLGAAIAAAGWSTRYNEPYSGVEEMIYSAERHGRHYGLPFLELEVNQSRFGEPKFAATLANDLLEPIRKLLKEIS